MAVTVSQKYREVIYSGGAINRATLSINNNVIPNSNIKKITISSPIIDSTVDYFYIGTFIAQKVEIEFRNAQDIDLEGIVLLSIGTKTDAEGYVDEDGYENISIGQYYIDTTPEDYYQMAKITCYDKSILFKQNIDISQWFDEETYIDEETGEQRTRKTTITAENLLINLCKNFLGDNMLGTYPQLHRNLRTGFYDNTKSGKFYISQIAEIMGANAKIGRDGKLYLIPVKQTSSISINALKSKSWETSTYYKISRVYYEDGDSIYEHGTTDYNSLNISVDNMFINGDNTQIQTIIDNLFTELNGFEMYAIKTENYGDPSLDCWDLITYNLGEESYLALNDNILTYEMNLASTVNPIIPSKTKQEYTNVINREDNILNIMKTEIDQVNNKVTQTNSRISTVQDSLDNVYTKEQTNQLIRSAESGLTNLFTNGGGSNLLTNTAPYRYLSDTTLESWNGNITGIRELESINKNALLLLNNVASQSVDVTEGTYFLAFKFKQLIPNSTLVISYNGREITIANGEVSINDEEGYELNGNEISTYGEILGTNFTISFDCDTNQGYEIYELRLGHGRTILAWTQNQNEFKTTSVNIGEGITITSNSSNTINKLDTDGMVVTNKTNGIETLRATDTGIITNDLEAKGKSSISGMSVQKVGNNHVFINGIKES